MSRTCITGERRKVIKKVNSTSLKRPGFAKRYPQNTASVKHTHTHTDKMQRLKNTAPISQTKTYLWTTEYCPHIQLTIMQNYLYCGYSEQECHVYFAQQKRERLCRLVS